MLTSRRLMYSLTLLCEGRRRTTMSENYKASAIRHFSDAENLANAGSFAGAGHLIGFSAECAIKFSVENAKPNNEAPHLHFPQIIEAARKQLHQRRQAGLNLILQSKEQLMSGCSIGMRYLDDNSVSEQTYKQWRSDASRILMPLEFQLGIFHAVQM